MQNDEHNKELLDEAAGEQKEQPIRDAVKAAAAKEQAAKRPEPPEGATVVRIWRTGDGKTYLDDADLGPGPTFDLLNWALLTVKMPFFYREMTKEMMRMVAHIMKQMKAIMEEHESHYHHREVPDKSRDGFKPEDNTTDVSSKSDTTGVHPSGTSASPEVPEYDPQSDSAPLPDLPTDRS